MDLSNFRYRIDDNILISFLKKIEVSNLQSFRLVLSEQITPKGFEHLSKFDQLRYLDLSQNKLADDTLIKIINSCSKLRVLKISGCQSITDHSIKFVGSLKYLVALDISDCTLVTDKGIKHLRSCTNLELLSLENCFKISDEGIQILNELTNLRILSISNCILLGKKTVNCIHQLKKLLTLNIAGCYINPNDLVILGDLPLKYLNLSFVTSLTDEGLASILSSIKSIEYLNIHGCTNITSTTIKNLKIEYPKLFIFHSKFDQV